MEQNNIPKKRGRPVKNVNINPNQKAQFKKLKPGEERYVSILPTSMVEDLKLISYWSRQQQKEFANKAFKTAIEAWKDDSENKQHLNEDGEIKPRPAGA